MLNKKHVSFIKVKLVSIQNKGSSLSIKNKREDTMKPGRQM